MMLNLSAAAQAVLDTDADPSTLHVWKALTGATSYAEALESARDYAANPEGEGIVLATAPTEPGLGQTMITLWRNGTAEVARRAHGERWSPPTPLEVAP